MNSSAGHLQTKDGCDLLDLSEGLRSAALISVRHIRGLQPEPTHISEQGEELVHVS